jgi:hypothetical protein
MMKALDPERAATGSDDEHMVLPNVLCPWGCCEFPFRTASLNPALLLQHHLPKVQLNLPSALLCQLHTVESSRLDYIRKPNEQLDYVLLNPKWPICASVRMTWQGGLVICTCRHHDDTKKRSYLYSHVPRKPDGFNLSSVHTDELAHAVMKSRVARPVCKKGMNTTPSLHVFRSDYAGCDSGDVIDGVGARFGNNGIRFMNFIHESESLNREDIKELCAFYLKQGLITQDTIDDWESEKELRCGDMMNSIRGSTYTPTWNAIHMQKVSTENDEITVKIKKKDKGIVYDEFDEVRRTWAGSIYNMQVEDGEGYGWRMKAIPQLSVQTGKKKAAKKKYNLKKGQGEGDSLSTPPALRATMLTYVLLCLAGLCKEFYHILDNKNIEHSHDNFSGHMLTFVHHTLMKHCDSLIDKRSPFSGTKGVGELLRVVKHSLDHLEMVEDDFYDNKIDLKTLIFNDNKEKYFGFSFEHLKSILPVEQYPKLKIVDELNEETVTEDVNVLVVVTDKQPIGRSEFSKGKEQFEARTVVALYIPDEKPCKCNKFSAKILARHGDGFDLWWEQNRGDQRYHTVMTQVDSSLHLCHEFPKTPSNCFQYVTVYVRRKKLDAYNYKLDMHKSLGGQCQVFCDCKKDIGDNPLIVCGKSDKERRLCMRLGCKEKEYYQCADDSCSSRICMKCFSFFERQKSVHHIDPATDERLVEDEFKEVLVGDGTDDRQEVENDEESEYEDPDVVDDDTLADQYSLSSDVTDIDENAQLRMEEFEWNQSKRLQFDQAEFIARPTGLFDDCDDLSIEGDEKVDNEDVRPGLFIPSYCGTKADRMVEIGNSLPSDRHSGVHNRGRSRFVSRFLSFLPIILVNH